MSRGSWGAISRLALQLAVAVAACNSPAHAQDFPRGKNIALVIGNTAGSGYDSYGRLIGRYMSKHLPGKPNIVPQNMPGAGGTRAAEYIYSIAPKDGTSFGIVMPGALVDPLAGGPAKYRYDPSKFEYIGNADSGTTRLLQRREIVGEDIRGCAADEGHRCLNAAGRLPADAQCAGQDELPDRDGLSRSRRNHVGAGARRRRCDLSFGPQRHQFDPPRPAHVRQGQCPASDRT